MRLLLAAALCLLAGAAFAEPGAAPPPFASRLTAAETPLRLGPGGLSGPGGETLRAAIAQARYVMLGEDRLSQEIPRFTSAVCEAMAPQGLTALAVEIGPEAARAVNAALRAPDRRARLGAFLHAHPDVMAFQNAVAESDMAADCARRAGAEFTVWGLDQEFFGAAGHLLEEMAAARPGPAARTAIAELSTLEQAATRSALASGSPSKLFVYTVTDAQMAAAGAAVAKDGGRRVKALFEALDETRTIYLASASGLGDPNGQRARLMKRVLAARLAAAPAPPRLLMKFGYLHMFKGVNPLRQRDLGNFVAEHADGEGATSLHVAVLGVRGVHGLYGGVGRPLRREPFTLADDEDFAWVKEALATRPATMTAHDWMVLDLRPLREAPLEDLSAQWRQLIAGYDLVVLLPAFTPTTLMDVGEPAAAAAGGSKGA